jgi:hypothetical protein
MEMMIKSKEIFQHFLLTRFNVRVNYHKSKPGIGLNRDWLEHRFELFDRYCFPSVQGQSNLNFKWLVFFDRETPEDFQHKIKEYTKWNNFIPVYIDYRNYLGNRFVQPTILNYIERKTRYLITSRIDNDDAIALNFIEIIQNNFRYQDFEFLNFPNGYVLAKQKLYSRTYLSNPFISLVESIHPETVDGFKTIYCGNHYDLSSVGTIKQIQAMPTWLQVIHENNVTNRVRGIREPINRLQSNFCLNIDIPQQENLIFYWLDKLLSFMQCWLEFFLINQKNLKKIKLIQN